MPWYHALLVVVGGAVLALLLAVWIAARMFLAALFKEW